MIHRLGLICLAIVCVGCESSTVPPTQVAPKVEPPALGKVQEIIGGEIGLKAEEIAPGDTFAGIGVDGLDFARIINELQEQLDVTIATEKLSEVTGEMDPKQMPAKLTVRQLATIVSSAQNASEPADESPADPSEVPETPSDPQ